MSEVKRIRPSLSKGTRDFLPSEVAKRNYIFDTIKSVFRKYGFEQIETPAIERLETLTGKYGEEGDKLLFKILNSGDFLKDVPVDELSKGNPQSITKYIAEKGLRYDLTVPLARYVVQHQDNLAFPFKRFHIGPVWRADRPQKGRYQEFYQCDADVIGSNSVWNEVELTSIYSEAFEKLKLDVTIKYNSRKLIQWLAEYLGFVTAEKIQLFTTELDKLDKSATDDVVQKINSIPTDIPRKTKFDSIEVSYFKDILQSDVPKLKQEIEFNVSMVSRELALVGVAEIEAIQKNVSSKNTHFSLSLARGLDYYTGIIWEVQANGAQMGSIGGGGRYDNLTEMFGGQNMSGVGISFGIERIYDVMEELNLFPQTIAQGVKVLFVPRDRSVEEFTFQQTQKLRNAGVSAEIFLGNVKKQKQFNYAEQKNISYLVEAGENEWESKLFRLRNARTRETENDLTIEQIIEKLQ